MTPATTGEAPRGEAPDPPWPERPDDWRHDAPDPPEAFGVPFTVLDGLACALAPKVAVYLVASVLVLAGGAELLEDGDVSVGKVLFVLSVQLVGLGLVVGWLARRRAISWRLLGPLPPSWRKALVGVGVGVAGYVVVAFFVQLVVRLAGGGEIDTDQALLDGATSSGAVQALAIVSAVLVAPVVEELVYRGVLFQAGRRRFGLFPGMFLSAGVWSVSHLELLDQPLFLFAILILGLWLAAAFHRTGSLVVPVIAHATFNAISVALALTVA